MRDLNYDAIEMTFQTGHENLGSIFGGGEQIYKPGLKFLDNYISIDSNELRRRIEKAIYKSIVPHKDKKIGVLLSGGVDSTLTLYLIKKFFPATEVIGYNAYNVGDASSDERRFAKIASDFVGTSLKIINFTPKYELEHLQEAINRCDSIRDGMVWCYAVTKEMHDDGMDVIVPSHGIDSLLANCGQHEKYFKRKIKLFPLVNTKYKYFRYASMLFGTDKAWFINMIALNPGKRYITGSKLDFSRWYEGFKEKTLWNTVNKWLFGEIVVKQTLLHGPLAESFGMTSVFPYMDEEFVNYCINLKPDEIYNKIPLRNLMLKDYRIPASICSRGLDWDHGLSGKMGGEPKASYYVDESNYYHRLLNGVEGIDFLLPVERWVIKGYRNWIKTGNRRARHLGYLMWQMKNNL